MQVTSRPASPTDFEVTLKIKKEALGPYIEQVWGWDEQFQRAYHTEHFNSANTSILIYAQQEVGLLEVTDSFFIQNLLIIPDFQNKGIGTCILKQVMMNALEAGKPVLLNVLKVNSRALKLYESLGFVTSGTTDLLIHMVLPAQHEVR
ncbi:MAG TPA: GNAT family N-acetyltransferase [Hymenobacter sp.]|jgi:ribosomal protein S18 acetylase RimI-like enzyme